MSLEREVLKATVAIWLTNGNKPVEAVNEVREFIDGDWWRVSEVVSDLVEDGLLLGTGDETLDVVPTAKAVLEALS